jgi:phosphatidate cytidylyltransferase
MAVILIPAVIIPELIRVLDVILLGACVIASFELLNMYDRDKKIPLWLKIVQHF